MFLRYIARMIVKATALDERITHSHGPYLLYTRIIKVRSMREEVIILLHNVRAIENMTTP